MTARQESRWRQSWLPHEFAVLLLGAAIAICLGIYAGAFHSATLQIVAGSGLYCLAVLVGKHQNSERSQKVRLMAACVYVLSFYFAVKTVVPALGLSTWDVALRGIDEWLFGQTPSVFMQTWASVWLNELMSACYLAYLIYLLACLIHWLIRPVDQTRRFAAWFTPVYAAGILGYLSFPATGPQRAFPEFYSRPLDGLALTRLNEMVVASGSSIYDAFPSLHVLVTCALLDFDRRHCRRRFYFMLLPALGIFTSAIYLRYHYAVDLIAGGVLFGLALVCRLLWERMCHGVETGNTR